MAAWDPEPVPVHVDDPERAPPCEHAAVVAEGLVCATCGLILANRLEEAPTRAEKEAAAADPKRRAPTPAPLANQRKVQAAAREIADHLSLPPEVLAEGLAILDRRRALLAGRPARALVAAALCSAARAAGIAIRFDQFVSLSGEPRGTIKRYFRALHAYRPPPKPADYLPECAQRLGLDAAQAAEARASLRRLEARGPIGIAPHIVAAAVAALARLGSRAPGPARVRESARDTGSPTSTLHEAMRRIHRALNGAGKGGAGAAGAEAEAEAAADANPPSQER